MNGWIISTIVLAVILFVELVCFLTHKVKKHNRKKYKTYLSKKERRTINKWLEKYNPEDDGKYITRSEFYEQIGDIQEQIDDLRADLRDVEISVGDIYDFMNDEIS